MSPTMLTVGLDAALVEASPSSRAAFPAVDAEVVRTGVAASRDQLTQLGFTVDVCWLDHGRTAEAVYRAAPAGTDYDVIVIGGGVRLDPALTHLLEVLVSTTHELAPRARLCFNTGPATTADAVRRWWPAPTPLRE